MVNEGVKKDHAYTISPSPPPSTSEVKWLVPYTTCLYLKIFEISLVKGKDNLQNATGHFS